MARDDDQGVGMSLDDMIAALRRAQFIRPHVKRCAVQTTNFLIAYRENPVCIRFLEHAVHGLNTIINAIQQVGEPHLHPSDQLAINSAYEFLIDLLDMERSL